MTIPLNTSLNPLVVISGSVDPTSVAVSAMAATLYIKTDNLNVYIKQDNGLSTNWTLYGTPVADYIPSDNTKWLNPQPTTVQGALNRIAAVVGASSPIP